MTAVTLPDGRRLAYAEAGPAGGRPVLVLHGAIGTPLRPSAALTAAVGDCGIRYVMVSRPGFGASSASRGRTLAGFGADVAALADALRLERFGLLGVSAGGPYALAVAHALAARVSRVVTVSSPSPAFRPWTAPGMSLRARLALWAIATAPAAAARLGDAAAARVRRHPALLLRAMAVGADAGDRGLLEDPVRAAAAVDGFLAATAGGVGGLVDDYRLSARAWGFVLADVGAPVDVWHGAQDTLVPPAHAAQLAAQLPRATLTLDPDHGHFFFHHRLREVLGPLGD